MKEAESALADLRREVHDLAGTVESLLIQSQSVARRLNRLSSTLDQQDAPQDAEDVPAGEAGSATSRQFDPTQPSKPETERSPAGPGAGAQSAQGGAPSRISEGLRMVVSQMAAAGKDPGEIAERLRADFSVDDADAVVRDLDV